MSGIKFHLVFATILSKTTGYLSMGQKSNFTGIVSEVWNTTNPQNSHIKFKILFSQNSQKSKAHKFRKKS